MKPVRAVKIKPPIPVAVVIMPVAVAVFFAGKGNHHVKYARIDCTAGKAQRDAQDKDDDA